MIRRIAPALAAIALTACGGGSEPTASPTVPDATTTAAPSTAAPVDAGAQSDAGAAIPAALDFSAPLLGGGEIELGALAGRPVLLWFWAPW